VVFGSVDLFCVHIGESWFDAVVLGLANCAGYAAKRSVNDKTQQCCVEDLPKLLAAKISGAFFMTLAHGLDVSCLNVPCGTTIVGPFALAIFTAARIFINGGCSPERFPRPVELPTLGCPSLAARALRRLVDWSWKNSFCIFDIFPVPSA